MNLSIRAGKLQGWTQEQYLQAMKQVILDERRLLKNGKRKLNKNARPGAQ